MATNLYEYYTKQGKTLPTVQERQPLATQAGISGYTGTAEQNTQLLNYLKSGSQQTTPSLTDLQSAKNINIPPQPQSAFTGLGGTSYIDTTNQLNVANKTAGDSYIQNLQGLGTLDTSSILPELEQKYGLSEKEQTARNLQAQINQNVAEAQANIVAQGGRQASMGAISGAQADIERKLAIRNLPLTAQYQAAQGDFQAAQDTVNKLYTAKVEDATNQYNYKLGLIKAAYEVADAKEKRQLEALAAEEDRKYKAEQETINFEREKEMLRYEQQLKSSGAGGGEAPTIKSINGVDMQWNPNTQRWENPIGGTSTLSNPQNEALKQKVTQIQELLDARDFKQVVGTGLGNVVFPWASLSGAAQRASGSIQNLTSQETLNSLLNLKKAGGTLGALSDQERIMLQNAATKIGAWEIKDKKTGLGTGRYNVSEKDFAIELKRLQDLAQKAINEAEGEDPLGLNVNNDPLKLGI